MNVCNGLVYHRFDVVIAAEDEVHVNGWLGCVLRTNLLYAAGQVMTDKGTSLLSEINRLPLADDHPLFGELAGGFPKGYALSVEKPLIYEPGLMIRRGEKIVFSLVLFGTHAEYYRNYIEAVRKMCRRGLGHPMTPFGLVEVCECNAWGEGQRIAVGHQDSVAPLRFPIALDHFVRERFGARDRKIRLMLRSPLLLSLPGGKKSPEVSYQDKLNGFPGFYQFVRSAAFRCLKLSALYAFPENRMAYGEAEKEVGIYAEAAASVLLTKADLRWVSVPGGMRNDGRSRILLKGYVGEMVFAGDFTDYMPLLQFMQGVGVGNDVVYGLGDYRVEVLRTEEMQDVAGCSERYMEN